MFRAGAHRATAGLVARLVEFGRDRRAVAAVEFAFIAPILLIMYFITVEAVQAIETSKKVSRLGSMVADLVAQQNVVSTSTLQDIVRIGETSMRPYDRSTPKITITGIEISNDSNANPTVSWSYQGYGTSHTRPYLVGSPADVPAKLKRAGTFLIRVDSELAPYTPIVAWAVDGNRATGLSGVFSNINMKETFYLRPRVLQQVSCSNC